ESRELADRKPEFDDGKWFGQAESLVLLKKYFDFFIDNITGHENESTRCAWVFDAQPVIEFASVQAGHFPITNGQVKIFGLKLAQCGFAIGSSVHLISRRCQNFTYQIEDRFIVILDQNR